MGIVGAMKRQVTTVIKDWSVSKIENYVSSLLKYEERKKAMFVYKQERLNNCKRSSRGASFLERHQSPHKYVTLNCSRQLLESGRRTVDYKFC